MTGPSTSEAECVLCNRLRVCSETSVGKVIAGYTCPLFQPERTALVYARSVMMDRHGSIPAVRAMLGPRDHKEELPKMAEWTDPPPQGTTVSQRLAMFDQMGFPNVRRIGIEIHKCLTWEETLAQHMRPTCKQKVIDFELAAGIIVPDQITATPVPTQGDQQMSTPFQPGAMPPQMPMPNTPPSPPAPPQMPQMPQMPQFGAPPAPPMPPQVGMPPPAPQGMPMPQQGIPQPPQGMVGMPPPPPMAPPAPQQPEQQAPTTGRGRGKSKAGAQAGGAIAAPPPPPPPVMTQAPTPGPSFQAPGGFAPPQFGGAGPQQVPQMSFAPAPQAPAPMAPQSFSQPGAAQPQQTAVAIDLGPVLAGIDAVGKAVNSVSDATQKELASLKQTQAFILVALYHLYATDPSLSQQAAKNGWNLSSYEKFVEHLGNNLPR